MPRRTHTTPFTLAFGERMRSLRRDLGISLRELSIASGISKGHLSSIEQGLAAITTETIERIANGLDLSPLLLLAFPDEDELAATVDLIRQLPTTRRKKLRRILERWIAEIDAS
jgi:transcriptional regulator with XRE-family HTH domain